MYHPSHLASPRLHLLSQVKILAQGGISLLEMSAVTEENLFGLGITCSAPPARVGWVLWVLLFI